MSDNNQQQQATFKPNALNESKLTLTGRKIDGAERPPSLRFGIVKNQPRIHIFTNAPGDEKSGSKMARMDSPTFFQLLEFMDEIVTAPNGTTFEIHNKTMEQGDNNRKELVVDSKTHLGKDNNGIIYLSVTGAGVTPIQFQFGSNRYHAFFRNGKPLERHELSASHCKAFRGLLTELIPHILQADHFTAPKGEYGGGGGGGYQKNNNWKGNNNYNKGGGGNNNYNKGGNNNYQKNNYNGGNRGGNDYGSRDTETAPAAAAPSGGGNDAFSFDDDVPL